MRQSQTRQAILERHVSNGLLLSPSLPVVGRDARDLAADQPTSPPDPAIVDFVVAGLQAGQTHYVDVPGMPALRQALAEHLAATGHQGIEAANVLVTAGMQETRFLAIQILGRLLGPVALPEVVHPGALKALGVRPLAAARLPTVRTQGFLADLDGIQAALEQGAKVLFLESPVRLTGAIYDRAAVARIAGLVNQYEAAVIWDQGLAPWVADYGSIWNEPGMVQRGVLLGEAFPGLGLESWFIGYLATNPEWWERLRRDKQAISICTSTPDQLAAIKAAELYAARHPQQREALAGLREQAAARLGSTALPGQTASIIAVGLPEPDLAAALRKQGFGFADGADFGARGVIRLAVTVENVVAEAVAVVDEGVGSRQ